ncbi:MAG: hypothetical protein DMG91_06060 [Acidobacteria bacterium]|nr:MAG: hypothetical protein DMG91_06060 [Acidobacteriota bacterium]
MVTKRDIRELAQFECEGNDCALTFYFQPQTPRNKSHREEAILAKDLVRQALRESDKHGGSTVIKADLQRILDVAERLHGNQARAKAIFACGAKQFWREFDLPAELSATQIFVNKRFHLAPLVALQDAQPRLCVPVFDRKRARIFEVNEDEVVEREAFFHPLPRRGRGDGFGGYDAGHSERSVNDEVLHHWKDLAAHLLEGYEKGNFDYLAFACLDTNWNEFEGHLHPYLKKACLGHFVAELGTVTPEYVRSESLKILRQSRQERTIGTLHELLDQARSNGRGVTGLRRVLRSLEMGEALSLLLDENYRARAIECTNCGHLDAHLVRFCPVCGRATRELEDVCEAIIPMAIRRDVELIYVKDQPEFDRVGNIGALLRFRADQSAGGSTSRAS